LPDGRSGDGGPNLRPDCDQATRDGQGQMPESTRQHGPLSRSHGDAKGPRGRAGTAVAPSPSCGRLAPKPSRSRWRSRCWRPSALATGQCCGCHGCYWSPRSPCPPCSRSPSPHPSWSATSPLGRPRCGCSAPSPCSACSTALRPPLPARLPTFEQPDDPGRKRIYCSRACQQAAYRARQRPSTGQHGSRARTNSASSVGRRQEALTATSLAPPAAMSWRASGASSTPCCARPLPLPSRTRPPLAGKGRGPAGQVRPLAVFLHDVVVTHRRERRSRPWRTSVPPLADHGDHC
jgi:hypothetical protein